jgi:hypothetical protein
MSGDQIGDSFSGDDSGYYLNSSGTRHFSDSWGKSIFELDLSNLDSSSEDETARIVSIFWKAYKRTILFAFAFLGIITSFQLTNLIYLSASDYSGLVFFGLIIFFGYFYPIRVYYGMLKIRIVFAFLKRRIKILVVVSLCSLSLATVLSAYPIMRDYYHYYIPSPGTCLMLDSRDESTIYLSNVSCFSNKAFQILNYEIPTDEECPSAFVSFYDTWNGNFCLIEKRPPTAAELEILQK